MKHRCKICGKLDINMTMFGEHGWYHTGCVFKAWQEAKKKLEIARGRSTEKPYDGDAG